MNDMHLQIEKTFFELAKGEGKNCLVLCDRGIMDLSVCKCHFIVPNFRIALHAHTVP